MRKFIFLFFIVSLLACSEDLRNDGSSGESTLSGSYSTILTIGEKMYAVSTQTINTFDISDPKNPQLIDKQNIGFDIESLIHHEGILLIGSKSSMYIYDINSKGIPVRKSIANYDIDEICSSDPIVARGKLAYVTLSSIGELCRTRTVNELRIYNIEDIANPKLKLIIPMVNPKGLGLGKNNLYICDKEEGLVVMDISIPLMPKVKKKYEGFSGYDVIVKNNLLLVVTNNQLRQYDITNEDNIKYLGALDI